MQKHEIQLHGVFFPRCCLRRTARAVFTFRFYLLRSSSLSAPNLDSSQTSVASGPDAGVKDDLLLVGLMGAWSPAVPCRAVWLPVISSWHPATVRLIWLLHASKAYYTLKIFLNFHIAWISNDRSVQMGILWWAALGLSSNVTACMDFNWFYFYHSSKHFWVSLGTIKLYSN